MATENAVEDIKSRLDIMEVVSDYVALKRSGQNYKGLCPFHPEKTPSFMVNRAKQIFHCFGCGAGGDIFGFVMRHEGLAFPEVLELLAKRAGVELKPRSPGERGLKDTIKAANREARDFFIKSLSSSKEALAYLKKRGVSEESRKDFSLGYAPDSWHALAEHLKKKGYNEALLLKAGLSATGPKGAYDIFRGRLMFPISDMHGDIVAFGGRAIGEGQQPKYLNSPDTPAFHKRKMLYGLDKARTAMRDANAAVIVEGYLDVIMCHQHGIANAVAPLGTALTEEHIKVLSPYAERTVLVFDGDAAGVSAAKRSLDLILEKDLRRESNIQFLTLPENDDPASLLQAGGEERLRALLSSPKSIVDFIADISRGKKEKIDYVREIIGYTNKVRDPLLRDELVRGLTDKSGMSERELREELSRLSKKSAAKGGEAAGARAFPSAHSEEALLLGAAVAVPGKAAEILEKVSVEEFRDPLVRGIFEKLKNSGAEGPASAGGFSEAELALVSRLQVEPGLDVSEADRVVSDSIRKMEKRKLDERIKAAREAGDHELQYRLSIERKKLMQEA